MHLLTADVAFTVVVVLLVIVHDLFQHIRCYEQQLTGLFQPADDCNLSFVDRGPDDFVTSTSWVACESAANAAGRNYSFDINKQQIVVRHLFKKVGNRELIFAIRTFSRMTSMIVTGSLPLKLFGRSQLPQ